MCQSVKRFFSALTGAYPKVPHKPPGKMLNSLDLIASRVKALTSDRNMPVLIWLETHIKALR